MHRKFSRPGVPRERNRCPPRTITEPEGSPSSPMVWKCLLSLTFVSCFLQPSLRVLKVSGFHILSCPCRFIYFFTIIFNSYLLSLFEPFSLFTDYFKQLIPWFLPFLLLLTFYIFLFLEFIFLIFKIHSTVERASDFWSFYPAVGTADANIPRQEEVWGVLGTEKANSVGDKPQAAQTNVNKIK